MAAVGAVSPVHPVAVSVCPGDSVVTSGTIGYPHSEEPGGAQRQDEDQDPEDDRITPGSAVGEQ